MLETLRLDTIWNAIRQRQARSTTGVEAKSSVWENCELPQQSSPSKHSLRVLRFGTMWNIPQCFVSSKTRIEGPRQPGILRILFRTLQMDTVWNGLRRLTGRRPQIEEPQQARIKSMPILIVSLLAAHLLPISGALVLLAFNIRGY